MKKSQKPTAMFASRKLRWLLACSTLFCSTQLFSQGITTLICQGYQTNHVLITSSQTVKIKTCWDYNVAREEAGTYYNQGVLNNPGTVTIQSGANVVNVPAYQLMVSSSPHSGEFMIAGPATISLITQDVNDSAILTLDIEPGPYPPGKTATIGVNAGNVQVTLQQSTDLVNWTTAVNGQVYTNCPDARFFRIQLITNASP